MEGKVQEVKSSQEKKWSPMDNPAFRSAMISTLGKVLHILVGGGKSLEDTSKNYLEKTNTGIIGSIEKEVDELKKAGKGIIILNHDSGILADYLPLFAKLGDDILKDCVFYTGDWNLAMNQREFPDYNFVSATLKNKWYSEVGDLKSNIERSTKILNSTDKNGFKAQTQNTIKDFSKKPRYVFLLPAGPEDKEFKAIFQRLIKGCNEDVPVFAGHIEHKHPVSYTNILKSLIGMGKDELKFSRIQAVMQKVGDFKGKNGKKSREYYDSLFKVND